MGSCFVSIVSDNPPGSLPIRIDSTMSGARSVSRSSRAAKETSNPISLARSVIDGNLPSSSSFCHRICPSCCRHSRSFRSCHSQIYNLEMKEVRKQNACSLRNYCYPSDNQVLAPIQFT